MTDPALGSLAGSVEPGSSVLRSWALAGGISAQMTAVELRCADGRIRRLVLRRPGDHAPADAAQREQRLLQAVRARGVPSQTPLGLVEGAGKTCLWLEYIEGQPDFRSAGDGSRVQQMAAQLARIHSAASEDLSFLPHQAQRLEQLAGWQASPARVAREHRLRQVLAAGWPLEPRRQVLLHGDFWPGNILWSSGRLVAVIDWEDALVGDPLYDLAISRLDLLWIYGQAAMERFTAAYAAESGDDLRALPYYDLCAALRPGSFLAGWAKGYAARGRPDIDVAGLEAGRSRFAEQALARLRA